MKFKKIVGFGDSWMFGDELLDPELLKEQPDAHSCWIQNDDYRSSRNFLGLVGKHYDVPTENFGIPGGSLQSTIWTYLWWIKNEPTPNDCLVLIGLTEADRYTFYNPKHIHYSNDPPWNKFVHSTWVHSGSSVIRPEFNELVKKFLVLSECNDLRKLNYEQAMLFFDGQAARQSFPILQFHLMPPPIELTVPSLIFESKFNFGNFFWSHPDKKNLSMPHGHPNEKGHEIIRDLLIPEIDRAILSK